MSRRKRKVDSSDGGKVTRGMIWSWDIESDDWDQVRCVVGVSENGDVHVERGPGALERFLRFMEEQGGQWVAHAGGIYDTLLLSNERHEPWDEVVMSGSAVLMARAGKLKVRDSFRWWLAGLKKVGQYLDKLDNEREARGEPRRGKPGQWLKLDVDRARIAQLTDAEVEVYCRSDVHILLEGIIAAMRYLEERHARPAWTAGASALSLLEALEPPSWKTLDKYALDLEVAIAAGECVRGARVEHWALGKLAWHFDKGWKAVKSADAMGVNVYDLKSAYPAAYALQPVGIGAERVEAGAPDVPGIVRRVKWKWPWRDKVPPVLDQLTGAGAGWCVAWCVEEEVELLERYVKVERLEGWAPEKMLPLGQVFARELFDEKERGSFFGKVFLNALHGKFSESPVKEAWTAKHPKDGRWFGERPECIGDGAHQYWRYNTVRVDKRGRVARHIQPLAAAHILGRTRARLMRHILATIEAGGEVYYCDTDSVHTNLAPSDMPTELGNNLGQLAHEGGPYAALYIGPKAYWLGDMKTGETVKGALKGVPWNGLKDGVAEPTARGTVHRMARGAENGTDLRREVFERAWADLGRGSRVLKEGIASWGTGIRREGWRKATLERTIRAQERGKLWLLGADVSPTTWSYQTPAERIDRLRATHGAVCPWDADGYDNDALDTLAGNDDT